MNAPATQRLRGDRGQVGSIEVLPFGLLVFVIGSLLIANAWAVVDAKFASDAAAREAARTYVEAADATQARADAVAAGQRALDGHDREGTVAPQGTPGLERCEPVTFRATVTVPQLTLPFIGGFGDGFEVTSTHTEVVDPYRSGLEGEVSAAC